MSEPLPLLWWRDHGRFGQRTEARKFIATATYFAERCWADYGTSINSELRRESHQADDGRQIVQFLSLITAFGSGHESAFKLAVERSPTSEMRSILRNNPLGVTDLAMWHLAYRFCTGLFASSVMATLRPDDPSCRLVVVPSVERHSAAYANAAAAIIEGVPADMLLSLQAMTAALRAAESAWPIPPYRF